MNQEPIPSPFFNKKKESRFSHINANSKCIIIVSEKKDGKEAVIIDVLNMTKLESDAVLLTIAKSIVDTENINKKPL